MLFRSLSISVLALAAMVALAPGASVARSHASPTPSATPSLPPEDPAITQIARREFVSWQAGIVTPSRYAPQSQAGLTPDKVADTSKKLGEAGTLESTEWMGPVVVEDLPGVKGYLYKMTCANAVVYERLVIGADGKIDGIVFRDKLPQ